MSDPDLMIDFRGFAQAAAAAVTPDFADVVTRAAHYRRRRGAFGAATIAVAIAAGGGSAVVLAADRSPAPVNLAPVNPTPPEHPASAKPTAVLPWQTTVPGNGRGPQPQPQFTEVQPGAYDVTEPDKPLTGLYPELRAGDLGHFYLEYQDCAGGACRRMLAASTDGGRTWRKLPMPQQQEGQEPPTVALVHGSLVLVEVSDILQSGAALDPDKLPGPTYWASTDAGVTWHRSEVRTADAIPDGWLVRAEMFRLAGVDPATGNVVRVKQTGHPDAVLLDLPRAAGIWTLRAGSAAVSQDGGRTWETRPLPTPSAPGGVISGQNPTLSTADGRNVYVLERLKDRVRIHVSGDGGRTWEARALIDLDGPVLSLLPIDDRTVIVEGPHGAYRSTDQGRTFTRVGPSLGGRAHAISGGFTIPTNNSEFCAWVSANGAEWTYIQRPEVP